MISQRPHAAFLHLAHIEHDEEYQVRFSKIKWTDFTFGAGSRACLGRYLSQLEAYKLVASLLTTFDVS